MDRSFLNTLGQLARKIGLAPRGNQYSDRLAQELSIYRSVTDVHNLPPVFHYWSNRYLLPIFQEVGLQSVRHFFAKFAQDVCEGHPKAVHRFISIGSGNCDTEVELATTLRTRGVDNFVIECLDVNAAMLERGEALASQSSVAERIQVVHGDINAWKPAHQYHIVLANQSLHHFVELEVLFDKVYECLSPEGFFLADELVGRNGHMRWPEALTVLNELWSELPEKYKYNHQLKRLEIDFENWDCSQEGFEGIRAQDILPLLVKRFHFELFLGYANLIDIFVDRSFGHNFDVENPSDLEVIDRVQQVDSTSIERGIIKPTHMTAAMVKSPIAKTKIYRHLTPEFCLRRDS